MRQRGVYIVPNDIVLDEDQLTPSIYVGAMRYVNVRNEIITTLRILMQHLGVRETNEKNGHNTRVRNIIRKMVRNGIIKDVQFPMDKKTRPRISDVLIFKFAKGYGWYANYNIRSGYIKDSEIQLIVKRSKDQTFAHIEYPPRLIQVLLYVRMMMERPAGITDFNKIEARAVGYIMQEDLHDALRMTDGTIYACLDQLQKYNLIQFKQRMVWKKGPVGRPKRHNIYIISHYNNGNTRVLDDAIKSLKDAFEKVEPVDEAHSVAGNPFFRGRKRGDDFIWQCKKRSLEAKKAAKEAEEAEAQAAETVK